MAEALRVHASLTDLNLRSNFLKDEGVSAVCDAVQSNKETKLVSLNLMNNGCGPAGAKSVAAMVAVTASLTRLDVSCNMLDRGGEGVKLVRDAVKGREGFVLLDHYND